MAKPIRVRCSSAAHQVQILEKRLNWWTERLVESPEPTLWFLTASVEDAAIDGIEQYRAAEIRRRRPPSRALVNWVLITDGPDGEQIGARITGTLKRFAVRRARLNVSGTDAAFADRLARELSHKRWQLRRLPLPLTPPSSAEELAAANNHRHPAD